MGHLAHRKFKWFHHFMIRQYIRVYGVSLEEAELQSVKDYHDFSSFFTRRLIPSKRPIHKDKNILISPCDGTLSTYKSPIKDTLIQAKGLFFDLEQLLQHSEMADTFKRGSQFTIYLAPKDYHRVHMPYEGSLKNIHHIPGKRFSVNPLTVTHIKNLFCENERVAVYFDSPIGQFALIFVGALVVGSIHTKWSGAENNHTKDIKEWSYESKSLNKGDEVGYFTIGSTIILLTEHEMPIHETALLGKAIQFGQPLANCNPFEG